MYQFTSESVSEGHPDKVADLISDRVADYLLNKKIENRTAVETLVTTNMVTLAGEYKTDLDVDKDYIEQIVRDTVKEIGYDQAGFDYKTLKIYNELHGQSQDIALGTDSFGAGDQGIMFGYACSDNESFLPSPIFYSHKVLQKLTHSRKHNPRFNIIKPDSKCQITFNYSNTGEPTDIQKLLVSTQHDENASQDQVKDLVLETISSTIPNELLHNTQFLINPTGRFVIGGPDGDTGLTGRKIIVDTYGGAAPHGGGAFSGKDGSKVDRSAAYMARWIAKNIVQQFKFKEVLVQLSYAIGVPHPTSLVIFTDKKINEKLIHRIKNEIDLSPLGIIEKFQIGTTFPLDITTNYGHFGKKDLPWEQGGL